MTRPLSNDLRRRVVTAVAGGMSRRGAARRFGIAPSTAIKWVLAWQQTGSFRPRPQGGDRSATVRRASAMPPCGNPVAEQITGHDMEVCRDRLTPKTRHRQLPPSPRDQVATVDLSLHLAALSFEANHYRWVDSALA